MTSDLDRVRRLIMSTEWTSIELQQMIWFPKHNFGWYPVGSDTSVYDEAYFKNFESYKETDMGKKINNFRVDFVKDIYKGSVIDIGVGAGHFVEEHGNALGYDISKYSIKWLKDRDLFVNPYQSYPYVITCWDSLEHIKDCWRLVDKVSGYVFVSTPVFDDCIHALYSRHFKPLEHFWYFSNRGIIRCFKEMGFRCIKVDYFESDCGRDNIGTYAFERIGL